LGGSDNTYTNNTILPYYYITDHLGSTRVITDNSGSVVERDDYYPFGGKHANSGYAQLTVNKQKFNGKELQTTGNTGFLDYGARMYDDVIGRWGVVDPMAEKKPWLSAYHFTSNNPINSIDIDGKDDFELNNKGQINKRIENKNADIIYMLNNEGEKVENQSISLKFGTIVSVRTPIVKVKDKDGNVSNQKLTLFEVKGDESATKIFEFLADPSNTNVEWTKAKIGSEKSDKNVVGSSHERSSTSVGHYLRSTNYTLKEVTHNHPSGNYNPSEGDKSGAKLYKQQNNSVILNIYTHPNRYSKYDENGTFNN